MKEVEYKERFCWLDFQSLENEEKKELVDFLAAHTDFDARDFIEEVSIIKATLDFYPDTYLHILQDHRKYSHGRKQQTEFLLQRFPEKELTSDYLHPIYRRSNEIHQFNKKVELQLQTEKQVASYLRFFTEAIEGVEGPFYIVDQLDYYPGSIQNEADQYDIKTALEKHKELIVPIEERITKNKNVFEVDTAVLYSESLFHSSFTVHIDGMVKMDGDRPLEPAIYLKPEPKSSFDAFPIYRNQDFRTISAKDFIHTLLQDDKDGLEKLFLFGNHYDEAKTKAIVKIEEFVLVDSETIHIPLIVPRGMNIVFEQSVIFRKCDFKNNVNLSYFRIKNGLISFENSTIKGHLTIQNTIVNYPIHPNYKNNNIALDLTNLRVSGNIYLDGITLHHRGVNLSYAKIGGSLLVSKVSIDVDINCFKTKIEGNASFKESSIRGILALHRANIHSDLYLNNLSLHKGLNCRAMKVGVAITILGANIKGSVNFNFTKTSSLFIRMSTNNNFTRIEGDLLLSGIDCRWGHIEMIGVKIHGSLLMYSPSRIGSVYLRGETIGIGGFSEFISSEVDWGVYISGLKLKGDFNCYGLKVGGTRNIPTDKISQGEFTLKNCFINGDINFSQLVNMPDNLAYYLTIGGKRYDVLGLGQKQHTAKKLKFVNSTTLYNSEFSDLLHLNKDTILDYVRFCLFHLYTRKNKEIYLVEHIDDLVWDSEFNKNNRPEILEKIKPIQLTKESAHTFEISATYLDHGRHIHQGVITINGNAKSIGEHVKIRSTWESKKRLKIPLDKLFDRKPFYLSRSFSNKEQFWQEVKGSEKYTFLQDVSENKLFDVTPFYNSLLRVKLNFFKEGTLYAAKANLIGLKYPTEIQGRLMFNGLNCIGNIGMDNIKVAKEIHLLNSKVQGDISAQALKAEFSNKTFLEYATCSNIDLSSLEVTGDANFSGLRVISRGEYHGDFLAESAVVDGTLQLFDEKLETQLQVEGSLNLSNAVIANLSLSEKTFIAKQERSELIMERLHTNFFDWKGHFPKHLDTKIRDLEVGAWSEDGLNNLKSILKADTSTELKRNAYTKIENTLRNQGYEEKAEDVYKEMWQRIKKQKVNDQQKPFRSRLICSFRAWFGYGRKQAFTSMWIFVVFLIISSVVFSHRENVVSTAPSDTVILFQNNISEHPKRDYWGFGNSVWFTLRYNVPIIPFTALEQWEPNPNGINFFGIRSNRFTAQHYAHLVELSHWIIWSIFLIYLSGIIRRGEGK